MGPHADVLREKGAEPDGCGGVAQILSAKNVRTSNRGGSTGRLS